MEFLIEFVNNTVTVFACDIFALSLAFALLSHMCPSVFSSWNFQCILREKKTPDLWTVDIDVACAPKYKWRKRNIKYRRTHVTSICFRYFAPMRNFFWNANVQWIVFNYGLFWMSNTFYLEISTIEIRIWQIKHF